MPEESTTQNFIHILSNTAIQATSLNPIIIK